jgi:hypothetical protein
VASARKRSESGSLGWLRAWAQRREPAWQGLARRSWQPPRRQVGREEGRGHEGQHRHQRGPLQRTQPADAVAGGAAVAQARAIAHQKPPTTSCHVGTAVACGWPPPSPATTPARPASARPRTPAASHARPRSAPAGRRAAAPQTTRWRKTPCSCRRCRPVNTNSSATPAPISRPPSQVVLPAQGEKGKGQVHAGDYPGRADQDLM